MLSPLIHLGNLALTKFSEFDERSREGMRFAISAANSVSGDDLPIGAAVIEIGTGRLVLTSTNAVRLENDVSSHAEVVILRQLGRCETLEHGDNWLLAVTLEPCPMCAWAIRASGIGSVAFGAYNGAHGAAGSAYDLLRDPRHGKPLQVIGGVFEQECSLLMKHAFTEIRDTSSR